MPRYRNAKRFIILHINITLTCKIANSIYVLVVAASVVDALVIDRNGSRRSPG